MTMLETLARRGSKVAAFVLDAFNPDQERDENGRWTGGDGAIKASQSASTPAEHAVAEKLHREANAKAPRFSKEAQMHWNAALAHMSLSQTSKGGSVFTEAPKVSSGLSEFLGGPKTPGRGTAAQIEERGGKVDFQTALKMTSGSTRRMVASGNDPRTTSSHEQDKMEARQLARGERVPLKQGPTQAFKKTGKDSFNPDQPRDEKGMWASSGGGGTGASTASQHESAISLHSSFAEKARSSGNGKSAALHERARQAHLDVVHKETGKNHLLGSQGMKSVEELRSEAQKASRDAHEEDKNPTKGMALAYSTKEKPSTSRTTQTEMPAIKEAPVALMAPHSQLPVGNTKPKEPIHDLKTTQKLEAVKEPSRHEQAKALREKAMKASSYEETVRLLKEAKATERGRAGTTKESRRDAAAASAGRWASRALENAVRPVATGRAQEKYKQMLKSKSTLRKAWEPTHTARASGLSESTIRKGRK